MWKKHVSEETGEVGYVKTDKEVVKTVPDGVYKAVPIFGGIMLETLNKVSDTLMDLPSTEYKEVLDHIDHFLTDDMRAKYKSLGYLYKTGILLYGEPGTGKTSLVSRVSDKIVSKGGIVVYCESGGVATAVLKELPKDKLVTIILEEVDSMSDAALLGLMDGEVQRNNVIFLATTNYRDRIRPRLLRPSRLGKKIQVKFPGIEAREAYFLDRLNGNQVLAKSLANKSDGLSVDELKHIIIMTQIQDLSVADAVKAIKKEKSR